MTGDFERQWLADLPAEWIEKRADFLCNPYRVTVDPADFGGALVAHYSIPHVQETGGPFIEPAADIDSLKVLVESPTLLVSKLNPRKKTICIAEPHPEYVTLASSEFVTISSDVIEQRYAYYVWLSEKVTDRLSAIVQSATRSHQRVIPTDISKLPWKWPSFETQQRIARFLDEKTARIDALIEKKLALLGRLVEKRQALITRAVTKGLIPDMPMKPSGIDWVGDIPQNWSVKPLKFVAKIGNGSTPSREDSSYWSDGYYPWMNSSVVNRSVADEPSDLVTDLALKECHLPKIEPPAVLVGITGQGKTRGMATLLVVEATINQHLAYLKPDHRTADATYIRYLLSVAYDHLRMESDGGGSTKGAITCEQLENLKIPVPARADQRPISEFIDASTVHLDRQKELISRSLELQQTYRSALITAAVTGQLPELNG